MGRGQGFIPMGNFKFRSVKLDIFILNTCSVKPLSLSTGKKGQPGAHFLGLISTGNFKFRSVILCKTFVSLNGKEGTTSDSFQREITIAGLSQWKKCRRSRTQQERWDNQGLISMGNNRFTIPGLSQWENIRRS